MPQQLIIYIKDISTLDADWVFCSPTGEISSPISSGSVSELAEKNNLGGALTIRCVLNSDYLHFSYQSVPAKNKQRALQAIPFALEEQLAEDIEELHFATDIPVNNIYPTAVIQHKLLEELLSSLSAFNIQPSAVYADINCLPQTTGSWNILCTDNGISINPFTDSVIHCDADSFSIILPRLLQQTDNDILPDNINIWSKTEITLPEDMPAEITITQQSFSHSELSLFLEALNSRSAVNLLQGRYKVISQNTEWWKPWRLAAALAATAFCLQLLSGGLSLNRLQTENKQLEHQINKIYKQTFPRSKRIVNARVQMENKLKKLRKGSGKSDFGFTDLLIVTSPILQQTADIEIQTMDFNNNKLELNVSTNRLANIESLKSRLNQLGQIKAELLSSSSKAKLVNAKIRIEAL